MFNSSKSTRKFATKRVVIVVIFLVFVSGYSMNLVASAGAFAQTRTVVNTVTAPSSVSTTTVTDTVTNFPYVITTNGTTTTVISTTATTTTATTTSSSSSSSSAPTNTSADQFPSWSQISKIPQSTIPSRLNMSSNLDPQFIANTNQSIPYYTVVNGKSDSVIGLVFVDADIDPKPCWGYNQIIWTLVWLNTTGYIKGLSIWLMEDSYGYKITQDWLNTYVNRSVFEQLQFGVDAQPVTGATYSSSGIVVGLRDAGRIVVDNYQQHLKGGASASAYGSALILGPLLNIFGSIETSSYSQNVSLIALVCLFAAAAVAFELKSNKLRYGVWAGSILFVGFYSTRMVTMGDFQDFVHWIFPPFSREVYWYVLYAGVLVTSLVWGRFYCGFLCPFGTFTDVLNKISPLKFKIPLKYQSKLRYTKYVVLGVVLFEILQKTVFYQIYQIEPFGTFFQLSGDTFAWIFLGSILVISIFFNRFYCKYICPAGAGMALLSSLRMREIKRWPECKKCMICANQCEPQAINGDHISTFECMNCRGCEKLYLDTKLCPHYALERVAAKKQEASMLS